MVEDDADDVELLRRCFRLLGNGVTLDVALNGQEAMERLRTFPEQTGPDVILSDIKMPMVDGFAFLRWLKSESAYRRTPVVMLTSSVVEEDKARAYDLGASGYVVKPTDYSELESTVQTMVAFWKLNQIAPAAMG